MWFSKFDYLLKIGFASKKTSDVYPLYFLNIKCDLGTYDLNLDPEKNAIEFAVCKIVNLNWID